MITLPFSFGKSHKKAEHKVNFTILAAPLKMKFITPAMVGKVNIDSEEAKSRYTASLTDQNTEDENQNNPLNRSENTKPHTNMDIIDL
ncbi:uncharacterized protein G2W53_039403 [Senna tora]|uniref:Uncharacterized protein n=1 Tax=Senna tora TaxID=362788 RepID=A0A834STA5_9FABA|nr:uncharacterized protein G2W53_039403 [Senna tora]